MFKTVEEKELISAQFCLQIVHVFLDKEYRPQAAFSATLFSNAFHDNVHGPHIRTLFPHKCSVMVSLNDCTDLLARVINAYRGFYACQTLNEFPWIGVCDELAIVFI